MVHRLSDPEDDSRDDVLLLRIAVGSFVGAGLWVGGFFLIRWIVQNMTSEELVALGLLVAGTGAVYYALARMELHERQNGKEVGPADIDDVPMEPSCTARAGASLEGDAPALFPEARR